MAKKFSDESAFATLVAEMQGGEAGAAAGAKAPPRKEVKTIDDVQAAFAAATSARKQLVRASCVGWLCLGVWGELGVVVCGRCIHARVCLGESLIGRRLIVHAQQENAERAGAKLVERRKQLTALQTNLARDKQDLDGFDREMVRGLVGACVRACVLGFCWWVGGRTALTKEGRSACTPRGAQQCLSTPMSIFFLSF